MHMGRSNCRGCVASLSRMRRGRVALGRRPLVSPVPRPIWTTKRRRVRLAPGPYAPAASRPNPAGRWPGMGRDIRHPENRRLPRRRHGAHVWRMFAMDEADAAKVRAAFERSGAIAAAAEMDRLFPGLSPAGTQAAAQRHPAQDETVRPAAPAGSSAVRRSATVSAGPQRVAP